MEQPILMQSFYRARTLVQRIHLNSPFLHSTTSILLGQKMEISVCQSPFGKLDKTYVLTKN